MSKKILSLTSAWAALAFGAFASAAFAPQAHAQQTSADVRGVVIDEAGSPIFNARVTIRDTRSDRVVESQTSASGAFSVQGLRVGGPYRIEVYADGYEAAAFYDVRFEPGASSPLQLRLVRAATADAEIIVVGRRAPTQSLNNGVGTSFDAAAVENQPSIRRDLVSVISTDPLTSTFCENRDGLGSFCVGGANPRFNGFTIDGAPVESNLGLGFNSSPTSRSPISLDIVESVSVRAADYSVLASGFTGGLVNVVTKSGSNDWRGSLYYYTTSDELTGDKNDGRAILNPNFEEQEYGLTIGGPIVQDRLFFFAGYERFADDRPVNFSSADQQAGRNPGIFAAIDTAFRNAYGFDFGGRGLTGERSLESDRYFGKLDWNISDQHRASLSVNVTNEFENEAPGAAEFRSANGVISRELGAYTGEIFSDWSEAFSTQFRLSYAETNTDPGCNGPTAAPSITFNLAGNIAAGDPLAGFLTSNNFLTAGCANFRSANAFFDERLIAAGRANMTLGDHVLTFGAEYEDFEISNLFIQRAFGEYQFRTGAQIAARTPASISYNNAITNSVENGAAVIAYDRVSLAVQDNWQVTPSFSISPGLRYERFSQEAAPPTTPAFDARFPSVRRGSLDGLDIVMPRIGFAWTPNEDTRLTGGVGLFAGGDPLVWFTNAYAVPQFDATAPSRVVTGFLPVGQDLLDRVALGGVPARTSVIAPDFEIVSDWKASLRLDHEFALKWPGGVDLGSDYMFTAQVVHTRVNKGFGWRELNQLRLPQGVAPDGRPIYANLGAIGEFDVVELFNTSEGEGWIYSVGVSQQFDNGLDFTFSYAHQDIETVSAGTGSTAAAGLYSTVTADQNRPELGRSPFEVEHAFKLNLGLERELFGDLRTRIDLFGQVQSGAPFTPVYQLSPAGNAAVDNSMFGRLRVDFPINSDPIYVPSVQNGTFADPRVVFATAFNQQAFLNYINANDLTPGAIAERNANRSTWNQQWDVRLQQDLPFADFGQAHLSGNRMRFVMDIENVLNLLNDEWGTASDYPSFNQAPVIRADLVSAASVSSLGANAAPALVGNAATTTCTSSTACIYRYNAFLGPRSSTVDDARSVWRIRIGVRYEF